jgi:hypothetical protein
VPCCVFALDAEIFPYPKPNHMVSTYGDIVSGNDGFAEQNHRRLIFCRIGDFRVAYSQKL